jgi:hypothetical protein
MLEAIPKNFFSTSFRLQQRNELLGEVDSSIWREKARLELEDGTYETYRESRWGGDFFLEHDGKIVARATKPSSLRNSFDVEVGGRSMVLRQLSIWTRRFGLFDGDKQIGGIYPQGIFTRRANIDLPSDLPLPTRVFLFWLVCLIWKRQSQAAS